jgi:6-phosphogluconolactonase/glucosamine-6-phosphate isomerase/deaminase
MALPSFVRVFETSNELSSELAKYVATQSSIAIQKKGSFTVAFSGGSLPALVARKFILFKFFCTFFLLSFFS